LILFIAVDLLCRTTNMKNQWQGKGENFEKKAQD
jgi:hypothetical protein